MRRISLLAALALVASLTACDRSKDYITDNTGNKVLGGNGDYIQFFNPGQYNGTAQGASKAKPVVTAPEISDGWDDSQRGLQYQFK